MGQLNLGYRHSSLLNYPIFLFFSIFYTTGSLWERGQQEGPEAVVPSARSKGAELS